MTELNPLFMDISQAYSGDEMALPYRDIMGEGVVGSGDLLVSAGAGNSVNIAKGAGWVLGDTNTDLQPCYRIFNDAVVNKGITPDATNGRYVRVVAQINDATFAGATRNWQIVAIHGTPAGSPAVPALPASALDLATILVPAAAASSAAYTFTDTRVRAAIGGGQAGGGWSRLETITASAVSSVTTRPFPAGLRNLRLVWRMTQANAADQQLLLRFNGDTGNNYEWSASETLAGAANHSRTTATSSIGVGVVAAAASAYSSGVIEIPDVWSSGGTGRVAFGNIACVGSTSRVGIHGGRWNSSAAVTSVTILCASNMTGAIDVYGGF